MDSLREDLRGAWRHIARQPIFSTAAIATLALGIGTVAAAFSLVNALHFGPLPVPDAGRLLDVYEHHPVEVCEGCGVGMAWPTYVDVREDVAAFDAVTAFDRIGATWRSDSGERTVRVARVTPQAFELFGLRVAVGRPLLATDEEPAASPVAVIAQRFRDNELAGRPDVLGEPIVLDGVAHTIVGVLEDGPVVPWAESFDDVVIPLAPAMSGSARDARELGVVARLAPGVTAARAGDELAALGVALAEEHPSSNSGWSLQARDLRAALSADYRSGFAALVLVIAMVVAIGCTNLANLVLARSLGRSHEMAVRAALGAGRGRLIRQILVENVALTAVAGLFGMLAARGLVSVVVALTPWGVPAWAEPVVDVRVAALALAASLLIGVALALAPAWYLTRSTATAARSAAAHGSPRRAARVRGALGVAQTAGAFVMLLAAAGAVASFTATWGRAYGYDPESVLQAHLPTPGGDESAAAVGARDADLLRAVADIAGVRAVGLARMHITDWPSSPRALRGVQVEGVEDEAAASVLRRLYAVSPGFLAALDGRIVSGRWLEDDDRPGSEPVVVINARAAARLFGDADPVGRRLRLGEGPWRRIVGVVSDVRINPMTDEPAPTGYLPVAQRHLTEPREAPAQLYIAAAGPPAGVLEPTRAAIERAFPASGSPVVRSLADEYWRWIAPVRRDAALFAGLAGFAVLLALIGIYSVVALTTTQRTHEIGVRTALGARGRDVLALILRDGAGIALAGLVAGGAATTLLYRVLGTFLPTLGGADTTSVVVVSALLLLLSLLACALPARRALRVPPSRALRSR